MGYFAILEMSYVTSVECSGSFCFFDIFFPFFVKNFFFC